MIFGHHGLARAIALKPLGDAFLRLITMIITVTIFCTVVTGMAGMRDLRKVGRVERKRFFIARLSRRWVWWWDSWFATSCTRAVGSTLTRKRSMPAPALVNMFGNGVATVVVARWENELETVGRSS